LAMQPVVGLIQGLNRFPNQADIDGYLRKNQGREPH